MNGRFDLWPCEDWRYTSSCDYTIDQVGDIDLEEYLRRWLDDSLPISKLVTEQDKRYRQDGKAMFSDDDFYYGKLFE